MSTTKPLFVRAPTDAEREALEAALRSPDAFVLRRAQIILASAQGEKVGMIAPRVGFSGQTVRDVIHAFNTQGLAMLQRGTTHNKVLYYSFDTAGAEALRALVHYSPRDMGKDTSVWTLELAADVADARGLTAWRVSGETRPSAPPWPAWGCAGGGPKKGSLVPTRSTSGKKHGATV